MRRTSDCRRRERVTRSRKSLGSSFQPSASSCADAVSRRTLDFSEATWSRVISPEFAARCKSSQEATCMSLEVSRIASVALCLVVEILGGLLDQPHAFLVERLEGLGENPALGQFDGFPAALRRLVHRYAPALPKPIRQFLPTWPASLMTEA